MKKSKSIISVLLAAAIFMTLFTGCMLRNPESVTKEIETKLPGCEVLSVEESKKCNTYTAKYKDIEFHVYNEIKKASIDALTASPQFSTDYFIQVMNTDEVQALLKKHDISAEYIYRDSSPVFMPYAQNSAELRRIYDFIKEFNECVYDYLPEKEFFGANLKIQPQYQYDPDDSRHSITIAQENINIREMIDWDYEYYCTLIDTKSETDLNSSSDEISYKYSPEYFTNEDYESIPHRYIYNLYIDGKEFTSEKYDVKFVYRIEDKSYYAVTGYGQKFENNLGVKDHIHREIITEYYPDSKYTIDSRKKITTYEIDSDKYKMTSTSEDDEPKFYKNDELLSIKTLREIDGHTTGTNYFVFIKVDDWAELMGMKTERIDESGVYLSKN